MRDRRQKEPKEKSPAGETIGGILVRKRKNFMELVDDLSLLNSKIFLTAFKLKFLTPLFNRRVVFKNIILIYFLLYN